MTRTPPLKPPSSPSLSKAETQQRIISLKKWIVAGSLVGFVGIGGLIVEQQIAATATTPSSNLPQNGGYFTQPGGNSVGTPASRPVTGSGGS